MKKFVLLIVVFFIANVFDATITLIGINHGWSSEGNAVILSWIAMLGNVYEGVIVYKVIMTSLVSIWAILMGMISIRNSKIASYVLALGALATFCGGAMWLF